MNVIGTRTLTRRHLYGAAGVLTGALAAACGGASREKPAGVQSEATGAVEFWHIWSSGPSREWLDQAMVAIQTKAPKLQIQHSAQDFWTFAEKVTTAATAGSAPDVTMADSGTAPLRGLTGENRALDDRAARDRVKLADFVDYQANEVSYAGKTWGLPFRPDTRILYSNKASLKDAGLDPAKPPATWDELWSQSERLTKTGGEGTYARLGFYPTLGNLWFWTAAWANGAEFVDAKNVPTLNTRQHLETLEWYVRWAQRYGHEAVMEWNKTLSTGPESNPFFLDKLALVVNTNPYAASIKRYAPNLDWGVSMIPYKTRKASWGAGFDLETPAGGKNPDGAWELIKWLDLDEEMNRQAVLLTSQLVAVKAMNDRPEFTRDPVWKTVVESAAVTRNRPQVPEARTWSSILNTQVTAALEGRAAPREALEKAQAEVMGMYETNKAKVADDLARLTQRK